MLVVSVLYIIYTLFLFYFDIKMIDMPRLIRNFVEGEYYHITLRRVGDEEMFLDKSDYFRGIFSIYEFNDKKPVVIKRRRQDRLDKKDKTNNYARGRPPGILKERERLVDLVAFCFMPNHVHLLLTPVVDKGITLFISKFASAYPAYFKNKYGVKRKGYFFENRFHSVHIESDAQLRCVFVYIHINPVSLIFPGWKDGGAMKWKEAFEYCADYKWSSLKDYLGKKNFPSVTTREFIGEFIEESGGCEKEIKEWLKHKKAMLRNHNNILIE